MLVFSRRRGESIWILKSDSNKAVRVKVLEVDEKSGAVRFVICKKRSHTHPEVYKS